MAILDIKKRSEYKFRILLSLGVLVFVGVAILRTKMVGPGFWEMVLIGAGFAIVSIGHAGWALWRIDHLDKEK